ncbi:phage baseplate assembly protein V [uncultured Chryseobacterium sp.]|uniref:phage baseplate assembly protein V n=1 Tax=uncultured Chryseobacterium sp. TaxID=259322 RepID=UPI0025D7D79F|nr:phage baseplate assembly protein V [uncultured Chryseobacterium sp.]
MNKNISNSDRLSSSRLPGMARMVQLEIIIEGQAIRHFKHLRLRQSTSAHHRFSVILAADTLDRKQDHRLVEARDFLGKRITMLFRYRDTEAQSPERAFVGVITNVAFSQKQTSLGDIVLKGYSPTILMDAAPHFQSFGGSQPVNTASVAGNIFRQSLDPYRFDVRIDTQNNSYINYSAQYNETHYNYLARLAESYGEQFFYDGEILHFGKLPPCEKPLTLTYGSSVHNIRVKLNAVYTKPSYFGYNSSSDKKMEGTDMEIRHPGELASMAYTLNKGIYTTQSYVPVPLNANIELDVDSSQRSSRGSAAVEVFTVSGKTRIPFLYPGCVADLEMRKPDSNATSYFTRIMITEVSHEADARGNYQGRFKAIAEGTGFLPRPGFKIPKADPQIATVISNSDPLGQGRVQVRFQWQGNDSATHFIRMMSPDAGGTDSVQQNRGFVAVPEVGDQVMVGFEYHHPDFPFAMGGVFHGKTARGGGIDNHLKSIRTRSGIKVLMNDRDRSVTIGDPSGNTYLMDGQGNISVTAPKSITFNAGEDIEMNAGKNLEVKTGNSMEFMSGNLAAFHMISGAMFSTPLMEMSVPVHFNLQSGKTTLLSEEETVIQGRTTNVAGMEKLMIHSDQETTVNSKGQTQVLGKDGNRLSNTPKDYQRAEKKMDGRCLVHFRPKPDWKGIGYGFDWIRSGDTALPGDQDYKEITGRMEGENFVKDESEYRRVISTFRYYTFDYIGSDGSVSTLSYAFPYLSLYPESYFRMHKGVAIKKTARYTNTMANLELLVDIKRPVDSIMLKYDQQKFAVIHDPFPLSIGSHKISARINCIEEVENDAVIEVIASYKGADDKTRKILAGGVVVKANAKRYEVPVVFIEVKTDIGNGKNSAEIWAREFESQNYLNQALINPVFREKISLDCSVDVNPVSRVRHNRRSNLNACGKLELYREEIIFNNKKHKNKVLRFLLQELEILYPGKYQDVVKVFIVNESSLTAAGYAIPALTSAIIFKDGIDADNRSVVSHEIMHVLGLEHTFDKDSLFIFEKYHTDNIMDYSDSARDFTLRKDVYTTTHWQWNIMQNNAKREVSSSKFFKHPEPVIVNRL